MALTACGPAAKSAPAPAPSGPEPGPVSPAEGIAVTLPNGSDPVIGLLFRPASDRPLPAVLVAQGNPGFTEYQEFCRWLSGHGFTVLFIDWTKHMPPLPEEEGARAEWRKRVASAAAWRHSATDFEAGLTWLHTEKLANVDAAAGIGFCGGGVVLGQHAVAGTRLRTLIFCYAPPRLSRTFSGADDPLPDLVDLVDRIKVPVQGHYGVHDQPAPIDDAREFERRLTAAGTRPEFYYYPDAGHGFMQAGEPLADDHSWGFVPAAAAQAKERMLRYLKALK